MTPILIDVRDVLAAAGSSRSLEACEPVEAATPLARVPEDLPVQAHLLAEGLMEGLLVSGTLRGQMVLSCARCLAQFRSAFDIEVEELFAPEANQDDERYPVVDGQVDLEPMMRDAIVLSMPFAPLCRPDCLGLCERCGGDRNAGECTCPPAEDPRWAPLLGLTLNEE